MAERTHQTLQKRERMLSLSIPGNPISQMRPRFTRKGHAFNPQKAEKTFVQQIIKSQINDKCLIFPLTGSLHIELYNYTPIPNSWPKKRRKEAEGKFDPTRKDIDNFNKFNLDTMNHIIYEDDRQITSLYSFKRYSENPRVDVRIAMEGQDMMHEHAITVRDKLSLEDLDYMIRKANRLGMNDRTILNVFVQEDEQGKHYFFNCQGPKRIPPNCS